MNVAANRQRSRVLRCSRESDPVIEEVRVLNEHIRGMPPHSSGVEGRCAHGGLFVRRFLVNDGIIRSMMTRPRPRSRMCVAPEMSDESLELAAVTRQHDELLLSVGTTR